MKCKCFVCENVASGMARYGATVTPIVAPIVWRPVASARSRGANHSLTALDAARHTAASPSPSKKRQADSERLPCAAAVSRFDTDLHATKMNILIRVPSVSARLPETRYDSVQAIRKRVTTFA